MNIKQQWGLTTVGDDALEVVRSQVVSGIIECNDFGFISW